MSEDQGISQPDNVQDFLEEMDREEEEKKKSQSAIELETKDIDYFEDTTKGEEFINDNNDDDDGESETKYQNKSNGIKNKFTLSKLKFTFRQIPLPLIHPNFHKVATETKLAPLMYLNFAELICTNIVFPLNFLLFCFYMVVAFSNSYLTAWIYQFLEWGFSFIYSPIILVLSSIRYFLLLNAALTTNLKKRLVLWAVYIVLSVVYELFLALMAVGCFGSLGLVKTVIVALIMGQNFFPWLLMMCNIAAMLVWSGLFILTFFVLFFSVRELVKLIIKMKGGETKGGDNGTVKPEDIDQDGGNVVFFGDMAFVFK